MNRLPKHIAMSLVAACGMMSAIVQNVAAAQHEALQQYLADDVAAVAYVDIPSVDLPALVAEANGFGIPDEVIADAATQAAQVQGIVDRLTELGAGRAYVLLRPADLADQGFAAVIDVADDGNPEAIVELLAELLGANRDADQRRGGWFVPRRIEAHDGAVLLAMNDAQMERLKSGRAAKSRTEAEDAMAALGDADLGLVLFGNADSRRVIREMLPPLPAPFEEIDGALIADGLRWGGLTLRLSPQPAATLVIQAARDEVAQTVEQSVVKGLEIGKAMALASLTGAGEKSPMDPLQLVQGLALLQPQVDGSRLTLTLGDDEQELAFVRDLLAPAVTAARASAYRQQRMHQFKVIALAMLNYEDSSGRSSKTRHFPAHANYDQQGRPLLSWRVHVLPWMDENALYKQFRLDEPWDSKHNLPLVEKMPGIWADPDPVIRRMAGPGRTTYVVPYGKETAFFGETGTKLSDIHDGTSNTLMAVEVVPQRAVVWTKPEDWQVELDNPLAGVQRADRDHFTAVTIDGAAHAMPSDISPKTLRALLTKDGGDPIEPWW